MTIVYKVSPFTRGHSLLHLVPTIVREEKMKPGLWFWRGLSFCGQQLSSPCKLNRQPCYASLLTVISEVPPAYPFSFYS